MVEAGDERALDGGDVQGELQGGPEADRSALQLVGLDRGEVVAEVREDVHEHRGCGNENVASAIIGASRPEQVADNVVAAGVKLDDEVLGKIDEVLDPVIERDPAKTQDNAPKSR